MAPARRRNLTSCIVVGEGGVAGLVRNNNERKVQGPFSTGTITGKEKRKQARGTNVRGISQKLPQQGLSSVRGARFCASCQKYLKAARGPSPTPPWPAHHRPQG
jgi:hypothetical protein